MSSLQATPLFRFVHHRSPELYSEFELEQKYVLRPEIEDPYEIIIRENPEAERWSLLAGVSLSEIFTERVLKGYPLYAFSQWLAKNKNHLNTEALLEGMYDDYDYNSITRPVSYKPSGNFLEPLGSSKLKDLWTQLIYQVVHQQSLYVKEIIIQLLIADHVIRNIIRDTEVPNVEELNRMIVRARVVLPHHFFDVQSKNKSQKKTNDFQNKRVLMPETTKQVLKNNAIFEFQSQINTLTKELERADAVYQKGYQEAKATYDEQYERNVAPLLKQYQQDYDDALRNWCSVLPPNQEYDPSDPCKQPPYVEEPDYPVYRFEYPAPDDRFYSEQLSEESYTFLTSFQRSQAQQRVMPHVSGGIAPSFDFEIGDFGNYSSPSQLIPSFGDLMNEIVEQVQPIPGHQNTVINTPAGPTSMGVYDLEPYYYRIKVSLKWDKLYFFIEIGLPESSYTLSSFEIIAEHSNPGSNVSSVQRLNPSKNGNVIRFGNNFNTAISEQDLTDFQQFSGTISFNQEDAIYEFQLSQSEVLNNLNDRDLDFSINGPLRLRNASETDDIAPFIPSGFGMKEIGVADYNRVEQSTYCYVEGDVQHIENIMAREFKEKSTRRFLGKTTTFTDRSETENEQLSEVNTSNRFEMHNEISQVIANSRDFQTNLGADIQFKGKGFAPDIRLSSQTGFATHNSVENSSHQVVTQSKEVTERALERVVNKVMQERVQTIIEEYEENNSHGFDNRKGDQHVVGVYRWVDKIVKNQVINYGKRQMMEFMIPEPSKLYRHALTSDIDDVPNLLHVPRDPRTETDANYALKTYAHVNDFNLAYWAGVYNVELPQKPLQKIEVTHAFEGKDPNFTGKDDGKIQMVVGTGEIEIPEDYVAKKVYYSFMTSRRSFEGFHKGRLTIAGNEKNALNEKFEIGDFPEGSKTGTLLLNSSYSLSKSLHYSFETRESPIISGSFRVECDLSTEAFTAWKAECFRRIITAYEEAKRLYDELTQPKTDGGMDEKSTHPLLYAEIVGSVLKKNCLSYLIDQNPGAPFTYGKSDMTRGNSFTSHEVNLNASLDQYASFVKFFEQAFEWDIMSYNFYPFYWGKRQDWKKAFMDENLDPLFRQFLRSGMARVVVTVRPGFEEAVNFYLQTGRIWNGGEVPVIGDPLFLSLVDELRAPTGKLVGKPWRQRVPTALTILQADSIGLEVKKALPCACDEDTDFEDHLGDFCNESFEVTYAQVGGESHSHGSSKIEGTISGLQTQDRLKIVVKRFSGEIVSMTYRKGSGPYVLEGLPSGMYELILDADDLLDGSYEVTAGDVLKVIQLERGEAQVHDLQVNYTV